MTLSESFHAPPAALFLCPECGEIGNNGSACVACANELHLSNLSMILNRPSDEELFVRFMESQQFQDALKSTLEQAEKAGVIRRIDEK